MGEIEGNADAGNSIGGAPFIAQPCVGPEASKPSRTDLLNEARQAVFHPRGFDAEAQITQANVEELLGG